MVGRSAFDVFHIPIKSCALPAIPFPIYISVQNGKGNRPEHKAGFMLVTG
jgi:hypothetical protein